LGGTSFNQIGNCFSLSQIELVVEKRALTEFTWASQSAAQLQTALQQHIQHDRTAMALKFEHIFAGE
jgi:hypothetical protein